MVGVSFACSLPVVIIGAAALNVPAAVMLVFLSGFLGLGSYAGFNVVSAGVYPVRVRSAGVGWALSVGKAGAAADPLAACTALALKIPPEIIARHSRVEGKRLLVRVDFGCRDIIKKNIQQ